MKICVTIDTGNMPPEHGKIFVQGTYQVKKEPRTESGSPRAIDGYAVVCLWWCFFWRYAVLWTGLLLAGGYFLNLLFRIVGGTGVLFLVTFVYSSLMNAVASFAVFWYILNRPLGKAHICLSIRTGLPVLRGKFWSWFQYYWRFLLFSLGISMFFGALLPVAALWMGQEPLVYLRYSRYVGNLSILPASLLAFLLLLRRKGDKNLLRISSR